MKLMLILSILSFTFAANASLICQTLLMNRDGENRVDQRLILGTNNILAKNINFSVTASEVANNDISVIKIKRATDGKVIGYFAIDLNSKSFTMNPYIGDDSYLWISCTR
jgi:hypothetical protein